LEKERKAVVNKATKTMKAAVVHSFGQPLCIEEVAIPEVGPNDVLMKVEASGVCHTDLHTVNGDWPNKPRLPLIPGHEGVGFVAAVGNNVSHIKEGDRIGVPWLYSACGHCEDCRTGWETLCPTQKNCGYSVNGCFAEYVLADPTFVGHLPKNLEFGPAAPLLCAGVTVYKGLKETEVRPGQWVVISGIGGLGHMAIQYAKAMGMHSVAVDVRPEKLQLAKSLGADLLINAAEEEPVAAIHREIGGAHGVLVLAAAPKAFAQAVHMVRSRGTVVLVALPPADFPLPIVDTVMKRITVRGSIVGTRQDLEEALQFAGEGKVSSHFSWDRLEGINEIFDRLKQGTIDGRVVMQMD
jgi:alcohol dehydrogenase, propanol-preferring